MKKKIGYIYSPKVSEKYHDSLPSNLRRSSIVHKLIESLGFFNLLDIKSPPLASSQDLLEFHSLEYLTVLSKIVNGYTPDLNTLEEFGLVDDCPLFDGMVPHIRYTAGGSIFAASMLCSDGHDIVIHWDGGRHHAHCSKASGFCYVNDIVLGLQYLRTTFSRIFYLDLDIHYGDGVESAFPNSISIYPLSIHHASVGYFPNTGLEMSKYKIPLSQTLYNDTSFICVLEACLPKVLAAWKPDVVVIQCGADTLKSDPIGRIGSLSEKAYLHAFQLIKTYAPDAKWLLLGGGTFFFF
ncbi:hypothetical protein HMI56_006672 [Coelomomyces lativittatus]|nr:hypothetical protein HMI56_006672 [Coelomomyces lativittatus]